MLVCFYVRVLEINCELFISIKEKIGTLSKQNDYVYVWNLNNGINISNTY